MSVTMRRDFYEVQRSWTNEVLLDRRFTHAECRVAVLWAQKFLNRRTEDAYVAQATLADELGVSPKTAQRAIGKLESLGYIEDAGYYRRARQLRMTRKNHEPADGGQRSPMSPDRDDDVGQSEPPDRTLESAETGRQSPPNHSNKTSKPVSSESRRKCSKRATAVRPQASELHDSLEAMTDWQGRQLTAKWERHLLTELRKTNSVNAIGMLRDAEKLKLAFKLERDEITLEEAAAQICATAVDRPNHQRSIAAMLRHPTSSAPDGE